MNISVVFASENPLIEAVRFNDRKELIRLANQQQYLINLPDSQTGKTPLIVGIESENLPFVDYLVRKGAGVNVSDYNTFSYCYVKKSSKKIKKYLQKVGLKKTKCKKSFISNTGTIAAVVGAGALGTFAFPFVTGLLSMGAVYYILR